MKEAVATSYSMVCPKKVGKGSNQKKNTSPRILDLPVLFITYGHVRDRDRSRLVSAVRWQHANLMDYEV